MKVNISDLQHKIRRISCTQVKYFRNAWHNIEKQKVSSIPRDINGHVAFAIHAENRADLLQKCRDGYSWKKDSQTEWKGYHSVRYRDCAGFKECESYECTYLQNFGERKATVSIVDCKVLIICAMQGNILLFEVTRRQIFSTPEFISVYINHRKRK